MAEELRGFTVGDLVLRYVHPRRRSKKDSVYAGPMVVREKHGDRVYRIADGDKDYVVHVNDLKRYELPGCDMRLERTALSRVLQQQKQQQRILEDEIEDVLVRAEQPRTWEELKEEKWKEDGVVYTGVHLESLEIQVLWRRRWRRMWA